MTTPTVFVSYAHEEPDHDQWVIELASNLRHNAVDASLDAWDLIPGQDTTYFMESQIRNSDFVILICTPLYAEKSNIPRGGVGYEKNIISAEMLQVSDLRPKFIPVLRKGTFEDAIPTYLGSKYAIDFSDSANQKGALNELLRAIFQQPHPKKPFLGKNPFSGGATTIEPESETTTSEQPSTVETPSVIQPVVSDVEIWEKEAVGRFEFLRGDRISDTKKDPFLAGFWQAIFVINAEMPAISLKDFLDILKASKTDRTGWDIGWVPTRTGIAPYPYKNGIEVWLAEDGDKGPAHSDFWRAEPTGRFSLFRGYQEDERDFTVKSEKKLIDFSLVLWRVSEFLLYLENFAKQLKMLDASAALKLHWRGLKNRQLCYHKDFVSPYETDICIQDSVESTINIASCSRIKNNLIHDVHKITLPLFEAFNFFTIEEEQIKEHIRKLFDPDKELDVQPSNPADAG
ncbi:MAG: toll/interleukin-1 receptor domain-containing protein [Nitrospinae bacterium]|nr:toll/interleukin-1 receptor domain-containing protein [Nitrospinota bacterium]